jgi:outer membrane biosynthesis protein TonB
MLDLHKFNNYAFFCPVSRLHLTVSSPIGFTNEVTPAILKALKAKTILDVDGVVNIETGTVKEAKQEKAKKEEVKPAKQAPVQEAPVHNPKEVSTKEANVEEPKKKAEKKVVAKTDTE